MVCLFDFSVMILGVCEISFLKAELSCFSFLIVEFDFAVYLIFRIFQWFLSAIIISFEYNYFPNLSSFRISTSITRENSFGEKHEFLRLWNQRNDSKRWNNLKRFGRLLEFFRRVSWILVHSMISETESSKFVIFAGATRNLY